MAKKLFTVFAFAIVLSVVSSRVVRDAPNKPDITVSDIYEQVSTGIETLKDDFMKFLGVNNAEELEKKAADTGKDIAAKLDSWVVDIKKETENWKDLPAVKSLQETAEKTLQDFKTKNPQTAEEIKSFFDKASKGTEEVVQKIKALGESEDAQKLKELSKKLLEDASNTVQNIAKDVQENIKKQ